MKAINMGMNSYAGLIAKMTTKAKMCVKKYHVLIFFGLFLHCHALNCRSEGGPKEDELKKIYRNCLRKQESRNNSVTRGYVDDEWRDSKGRSQKSPWERDGKLGRDDRMNRDDRMGERPSGRDDGMYNDRIGRDDIFRDDRMSSYDRIGSNFDRMNGNYDRSGNREDRMSRDGDRNNKMGSRYDSNMMGSRNDGRSQISSRDDFPQNEDFGEDMSPYNSFRSSTQSSRRYKREKKVGTNSGKRSQYNPNTYQRPNEDVNKNDNKSASSNSTKKFDVKACAMHCFLENLEMTGDNAMPDRYLVTHAITKDVKNEDLRDFLQESIEECFQILDNENTEDKCEFSKNLLMCLSEKGRANCDDWKDTIQF